MKIQYYMFYPLFFHWICFLIFFIIDSNIYSLFILIYTFYSSLISFPSCKSLFIFFSLVLSTSIISFQNWFLLSFSSCILLYIDVSNFIFCGWLLFLQVLFFSTMTRLLDVMEEYLQWKQYRYLRLDGHTSGGDRGALIELFNRQNSPYFIFLLR